MLHSRSCLVWMLVAGFAALSCWEPRVAATLPRDPASEPPLEEVAMLVSAAEGGTLRLPSGTTVVFPPGALAVDTEIVAQGPAAGAALGAGLAGWVRLGPDDVSLLAPVLLTLHYDDAGVSDERLVELMWVSRNNPVVDQGSEQSYFAPLAASARDPETNTLAASLTHFSLVGAVIESPAYLALHLDGKYLERGDILFVLGGAASGAGGEWHPGHVGLYLGTNDADPLGNDGSTVIESTPQSVELGYPVSGVQLSTLAHFKSLFGQHLYLGARRPRGHVLTKDERQAITESALAARGVTYSPVGGETLLGLVTPNSVSCTGLVDQVYDAAGVELLPDHLDMALLPLRLFNLTAAVDTADVRAGEPFTLPVRGAVRVLDASDVLDNFASYTTDPARSSISVSATPDIFLEGAAYDAATQVFSWTPSPSHVGQSFTVTVAMTYTSILGAIETISQRLTLRVVDDYFPWFDGATYTYETVSTSSLSNSNGSWTSTVLTTRQGEGARWSEAIGESVAEIELAEIEGFKVATAAWLDGVQVETYEPYRRLLPRDILEPGDAWGHIFDAVQLGATDAAGNPFAIRIRESAAASASYEALPTPRGTTPLGLTVTRRQEWDVPDQAAVDEQGNPIIVTTRASALIVDAYAPGIGLVSSSSIESYSQSDGRDSLSWTEQSETVLVDYLLP